MEETVADGASMVCSDTGRELRKGALRQICFQGMCVWLIMLVVILVNEGGAVFRQPSYQAGDIALNALQIRQAKQFSEIHGHYSRWRFWHPGPALFYVYALSEVLFHDTLPVFPAPHNAHIFISLALQSFLFVFALTLIACMLRSRIFIPAALVMAALHFSVLAVAAAATVPQRRIVFWSVWSPHVALIPLFCLIVVCAIMASGRIRMLPLACLLGGFLIHTHISQCLFVGALLPAAYFMGIWPQSKGSILHRIWTTIAAYRWTHGLSIAIVVFYAVPMLIDLLNCPDCNAKLILRHMLHGPPGKSLIWSVYYHATFFSYSGNQQEIMAHFRAFIFENKLTYGAWLCWILMTITLIGHAYWRHRENKTFELLLAFFVLLIALLTIFWGTRQGGEIVVYNSYYFFGVIYLLLLLPLVFAHKQLLARNCWRRRWILYGLALAIMLCYPDVWRPPLWPQNQIYMDEMKQALEDDQHPERPKMLLFQTDQWLVAAGSALAIESLGASFRVPDEYWFMYGQDRVMKDNETVSFYLSGFEGKQLFYPLDNAKGILPAFRNPFFSDRAAEELDNTRKEAGALFLLNGWGSFEQYGGQRWVWGVGGHSSLVVLLDPENDYIMRIKVLPYVIPGKKQELAVFVNGQEQERILFKRNGTPEKDHVFIARNAVTPRSFVEFRYAYTITPDPTTIENRYLSVCFQEISFEKMARSE